MRLSEYPKFRYQIYRRPPKSSPVLAATVKNYHQVWPAVQQHLREGELIHIQVQWLASEQDRWAMDEQVSNSTISPQCSQQDWADQLQRDVSRWQEERWKWT